MKGNRRYSGRLIYFMMLNASSSIITQDSKDIDWSTFPDNFPLEFSPTLANNYIEFFSNELNVAIGNETHSPLSSETQSVIRHQVKQHGRILRSSSLEWFYNSCNDPGQSKPVIKGARAKKYLFSMVCWCYGPYFEFGLIADDIGRARKFQDHGIDS